MNNGENFGQRMTRIKAERGIMTPGPGRPKLAAKYTRQIAATEKVFADAAPGVAQEYLDELKPADPERCPFHGGVLGCTDRACAYESQRTAFNHKAAAYALDRIMGKPTARSENVITVRLVEQLTVAFVAVFGEVNELPDPFARREAFAARLAEVGAGFSGATA